MYNRSLAYSIILSFVSPFLAFLSMLKMQDENTKRFLFIIIVVIYGTILPLTDKADGYQHLMMVYDEYLDMSWDRFIEDAYSIVTFKLSSSSSDLYKHIVSYISGSLLNAPWMFFVIVSFVYGYFFSGAMLRIFRDFNQTHHTFIFWVFLILLMLTKNIEGIQTVRTWTGLWILFYSLVMYHDTGNKKYLFFLLLPPFIHFGYTLMALPAYIVVVFGNRPKIYSIVFVLSSFTTFITPESVSSSFGQSELVAQKLQQYHRGERMSSEEKLEEFNEKYADRTWYKKLYVSGYFDWATILLIYILIFYGVYAKLMNSSEQFIFSTGLLMLAGSNIFFFIWAASNRMNIIGLVFILAALVMLMQRGRLFSDFMQQNSVFKTLIYISAITVLPKFIYHTSFFLTQLSIYFFMGPFVPWLDDKANISTMDVIKNLL